MHSLGELLVSLCFQRIPNVIFTTLYTNYSFGCPSFFSESICDTVSQILSTNPQFQSSIYYFPFFLRSSKSTLSTLAQNFWWIISFQRGFFCLGKKTHSLLFNAWFTKVIFLINKMWISFFSWALNIEYPFDEFPYTI